MSDLTKLRTNKLYELEKFHPAQKLEKIKLPDKILSFWQFSLIKIN